MRDSMKYINHLNEVVDFGKDGIIINESDFRDYNWTYNSQYNKVTAFEKKIIQKTLPLFVAGDSCNDIANEIFEKLEKDVIANEPGRMYVGDYYLKGYFYGSKKTDYTKSNEVTINLSFVSDPSYWIAEHPFVYRLSDTGSSENRGMGYAYGYPYDFLSSINTQNMNNTSFIDCDFILTVYGPVTNPTITIAGHDYKVNTTVAKNEYLVINSLTKTVKRVTSRGVQINEFANRSVDSYIFKKIPSGMCSIAASPSCDFDVVLLEERSEPKWI